MICYNNMKAKKSTGLKTFKEHSYFFLPQTQKKFIFCYTTESQYPLVFANAQNINAFTETVMVD